MLGKRGRGRDYEITRLGREKVFWGALLEKEMLWRVECEKS